MPPAARGCRPLDPCPGEMISPGPPRCRRAAFSRSAASSENRTAGLWASGVSAFESEKNEKAAPGNCRLKKGATSPETPLAPFRKVFGRRGMGFGEGGGKLFFRKVPSPSSRYLLNTLPMPRMPASSKSLPMSCMPTGRPSASPTGNERPGSPARFRDTV